MIIETQPINTSGTQSRQFIVIVLVLKQSEIHKQPNDAFEGT